jgi:hypothetical protein
MKKQFSLLFVLILVVLSSIISSGVNNYLGYMNGQRDALRGIYKIDQAERDYLDPEGARHHLARPE